MPTPPDVWLLHTDGACKGNPGPSGVGVALYKPGSKEPTATVAERIPDTTNNVAEYTAFIRGLKEALLRGADRVEVRTDSELMAHQINGRYKVSSSHILPLYAEAKSLLARFASAKVVHVLREQNSLADKLANQGVAAGKQNSAILPKSTAAASARTTPKIAVTDDIKNPKYTLRSGTETRVWRMERLWEAAKDMPSELVPVSQLDRELNERPWFVGDDSPSIRRVAEQARRIYEADLSQPVLLDPDGGLIDGGERLARAYLEGKTRVACVRLRALPEPDLKLSR